MSLLLIVRYPEEGPGLVAWARRMGEGLETDLEIVVCDPEAGAEILWGEEAGERPRSRPFGRSDSAGDEPGRRSEVRERRTGRASDDTQPETPGGYRRKGKV